MNVKTKKNNEGEVSKVVIECSPSEMAIIKSALIVKLTAAQTFYRALPIKPDLSVLEKMIAAIKETK